MANSGLYLRYALHRVVTHWVVYYVGWASWNILHLTSSEENSTREICSPESAQLPRRRAPVWFSSLRMSNITSKVLRWPNMGCPDEWPLSPLPNNSSQLVKLDPGGPGVQPMSQQKRALVAFEGRFPQRFWCNGNISLAPLPPFSIVTCSPLSPPLTKHCQKAKMQNAKHRRSLRFTFAS